VVLLLHRLQVRFLVNDMDLMKLEHHLYVVDSYQFQFQHLLVVEHLVALQNLDEQNLGEHLPYLDVVHLFLVVVVVGVELRRQLRMDYFQVLVDLDVVGVELRRQLRMDYFLDEELQVLQVQLAQLVRQEPLLQLSLLLLQLSLHRVTL
jgi:hypothetical protein